MKIQKSSFFKMSMKSLKSFLTLPVIFTGISISSSSANAITIDNIDDSGSLFFDGTTLTGTGIQYDTVIDTGLVFDGTLSFNAMTTGQLNGNYLFENGGTIEMIGTVSNGSSSFTGTIFSGDLSSQTILEPNVWDIGGGFGSLTQFILTSPNSTVVVFSEELTNAFGLNPGDYQLTTTVISAFVSGDGISTPAPVSEADLTLVAVNVTSTGHTLTMLGFGLMSLNVIVRRCGK